MAAQGLVISCTSTPSVVAGSFGSSNYHGYIRVMLKVTSGTGYLGDSGVTTAGYPMTTADSVLSSVVTMGETLYVCSSGAASLAVLRLNETT